MFEWKKPPVVIWCDDFGGAGSEMEPAKDCGWAMFYSDNGIARLHKILLEHPFVVVTMFTVPYWSKNHLLFGKKVFWDNVQRIDDNSRGFTDWLRELDEQDYYDFQLHGFRHKIEKWRPVFSFRNKAKQEFENVANYQNALEKSKKAFQFFSNAFGREPTGNRFPGWKPGKFGIKSMKRAGIKWFADNKSIDEIQINNAFINFPIGFKLNEINYNDVDKQLSNNAGLFITTHIEGATPTNPKVGNSVYYHSNKLENIISYIKNNYKVWWTGGNELSEYIYSVVF
jgi:hypothetical protein